MQRPKILRLIKFFVMEKTILESLFFETIASPSPGNDLEIVNGQEMMLLVGSKVFTQINAV